MKKQAIALLAASCIAAAITGASCRQTAEKQAASGSQALSSATPGKPARMRKIDVHTHLSHFSTATIIELMDEVGLDFMANMSGGVLGYGLEVNLEISRRTNWRILQFDNVDWDLVDQPDFGAQAAEQLRIAVALGARGLKIQKALGLEVRTKDGVLLRVDDARLDPLWAAAGDLGVPVLIHVADPKAFWNPPTPDNERYDELRVHPHWSFHGPKYPPRMELLDALNRVIARHPRTNFITAHFGNNAEAIDWVADCMRRYPNMYVDTAARIPEIGRHPPEKVRKMFIEFAGRILFGTDLGLSPGHLMLGSSGEDEPTYPDAVRFYKTTWRWFETNDRQFEHMTPIQGKWKIDAIGLPHDVLKKIYYENAARLLKVLPKEAE